MFTSFVILVSLGNMLLAQLLKLPIQYLFDRRWTPSIFFSTGGMPSSHSALVTALTLSVALVEGVNSIYFAISLVFAGVIVHDAIGIRREAGKHATVLNEMRKELREVLNEMQSGEDRDKDKMEKNLKELLGHEPLEALMGVLLGIITTLITYYIWIN